MSRWSAIASLSGARHAQPPASPERIGRYRRGRVSEWLAAAVLLAKGYRILGRRVRTPYGEIDLIAVRGRRLAFVEVKRRATRLEGRGRHHPAPGRPHRPGRRVLGQPQPAFAEHEQGLDVVLVAPAACRRTCPTPCRGCRRSSAICVDTARRQRLA